MTKRPQKILTSWQLCLLLALLILAHNLIILKTMYLQSLIDLRRIKFLEPGHEHLDFKDFLGGAKEIGFLTDKDMSAEKNDGQFLKAQYALAPLLLDLNNPNHEFLIIDPTSIFSALEINQDLKADFVHVNGFNKILAQRK